MTYQVRFTRGARQDLEHLYDFLLEKDLNLADQAVAAIERGLDMLETFPFSCRKAASGRHGPLLRELLIPFGSAGYVALFEISRRNVVTVLAVRHQRESDRY